MNPSPLAHILILRAGATWGWAINRLVIVIDITSIQYICYVCTLKGMCRYPHPPKYLLIVEQNKKMHCHTYKTLHNIARILFSFLLRHLLMFSFSFYLPVDIKEDSEVIWSGGPVYHPMIKMKLVIAKIWKCY
jgi:hypothetical protein